jgi:DNA replication protein DnaC
MPPQRGIDKALLRQLASCARIDQNLNTLITGATGTGKSYLACALGQTACRRGLRVLYRRMPRLLDELALAKADGSRENWHEWIGDETLADAILDRLVHNAYKLELKGPSRRKTKD